MPVNRTGRLSKFKTSGYYPYKSSFQIQNPAQQTNTESLANKLRAQASSLSQSLRQTFYPGVGAAIGGLLGTLPGLQANEGKGDWYEATAGGLFGLYAGYQAGQKINQGQYEPVAQEAYRKLKPGLVYF